MYINYGKGLIDKVNVNDATVMDFINFYQIHVLNPKFLLGVFIGGMVILFFAALTIKAVSNAAGKMVAEVRRQFREIPGILEGKAKPEYARCVTIATQGAQQQMLAPALVGILTPIIVGIVLGITGVLGVLTGAITCGFVMALMLNNSGGAWDNAKKYIEIGNYGGKSSPAHKATVVGDTVGDPFKDTTGPSLNILIKLMSMVSIVFAGLIVNYSIQVEKIQPPFSKQKVDISQQNQLIRIDKALYEQQQCLEKQSSQEQKNEPVPVIIDNNFGQRIDSKNTEIKTP